MIRGTIHHHIREALSENHGSVPGFIVEAAEQAIRTVKATQNANQSTRVRSKKIAKQTSEGGTSKQQSAYEGQGSQMQSK